MKDYRSRAVASQRGKVERYAEGGAVLSDEAARAIGKMAPDLAMERAATAVGEAAPYLGDTDKRSVPDDRKGLSNDEPH
jgi:hypothetical protein